MSTLGTKKRIELLPLPNPLSSSPITGPSDCARIWGGAARSRAGVLIGWKRGLYETWLWDFGSYRPFNSRLHLKYWWHAKMYIARKIWEIMGKNGNLCEQWRFWKFVFLHIDIIANSKLYIVSISSHKFPMMRVILQKYLRNHTKNQYLCQISLRKIAKSKHLPWIPKLQSSQLWTLQNTHSRNAALDVVGLPKHP